MCVAEQNVPVKTRSALPRSLETMLSVDDEWLQMQESFAIHALQAEQVLAERCQDENLPVKTRSALLGSESTTSLSTTASLDEEDSDEDGLTVPEMSIDRSLSATIYVCPFNGCTVCGSSVFISQHEKKCPCRMNGRTSAPTPTQTLRKTLSKQIASTSMSQAAQAFFQAPLNAGRRH